jgi:N-methylhydantoinase A
MIIGIDVGGTHTDAVLVENSLVKKKVKVTTDNANIMGSLLMAVQKILSGEKIINISKVVLSTTISTNAIVQNKIDRVGMVLQLGPGLSPEMINFGKDCFFIRGYINHRGISLQEINEREVLGISEYFQEENIRHIGVAGKFSTRNPQHELAVAKILGNDDRHFSLGHCLSGQLNFPRRAATAYLNASVYSIHNSFVRQAELFMRKMGANIPIYILKADGGTILIDQSLSYPVQTIQSGPAAGVMGILATTGIREDAVALDIGGTTTDISVFADGAPLLEASGVTISGRKTLIRGLCTRSIGIGGDSAIHIKNAELFIGPEREGPAAALDGPFPTPTDALIVLGMATIGDSKKAVAALKPLAAELNMDVELIARQILDQTVAIIADNVLQFISEINDKPVYTIHELLEGKKIIPRLVYVVGGPAEAIAPSVAKRLGYPYKIPEHSEAANALGAALARTTAEITVLADTEKGVMTISEEGIKKKIPSTFSSQEAIAEGTEFLKLRALKMGAKMEDLEMEVTEKQEFNMVREFYTTGKNIRVKVQIKPGLISDGAKR